MFAMKQIAVHKDSDDDVCRYEFSGTGRLIIDTIHGTVLIDVRAEDVNSFRFNATGRVDAILIPRGDGAERLETGVCDRCNGEHHEPGDELAEYDGVANGGHGKYCSYCLSEFRMEE